MKLTTRLGNIAFKALFVGILLLIPSTPILLIGLALGGRSGLVKAALSLLVILPVLYLIAELLNKIRNRRRIAKLKCTKCSTVLESLGHLHDLAPNALQTYITAVPDRRTVSQIMNDNRQWNGNVCTRCGSLYCSKCINAKEPSACLNCRSPTMPALGKYLRAVGRA